MYSNLTKKGLDYLAGRGITKDSIEFFKLEEALSFKDELERLKSNPKLERQEKDGKVYPYFSNRVLFPCIAGGNRIVGYSGRDLDPNSKFKYKLSTRINKKLHFFGSQTLNNQKFVFVFEGEIDAILWHQATKLPSIAVYGASSFNKDMVNLLNKEYGIQVFFFVGDNDKAGMKFNNRSARIVTEAGYIAKVGFLPKGIKDVGDAKGKLDFTDITIKSYHGWLAEIFNNSKNPHLKQEFFEKHIGKLDFTGANVSEVKSIIKFLSSEQKNQLLTKYKKLADKVYKSKGVLFTIIEEYILSQDDFFKYLLKEEYYLIEDDVNEKIYFSTKKTLTEDEEKKQLFLLKLI